MTDRVGVDRLSGALRSMVAAPFEPQTYLNVLYLSLAFPLGLLYLVFVVVGVSMGVALSVFLVGIPILAVVIAGSLGVAALERWLADLLLDVEVEGGVDFEGETHVEKARSVLTDRRTWTSLVYLPSKFLFGVATLLVVAIVLTTGVSMLFVPLHYESPALYVGFLSDRPVELHPALYVGWNQLLVGFETVVTVGWWRVTTLAEALVVAVVGVALCFLGIGLLNGLAGLAGWYTRLMLGGR